MSFADSNSGLLLSPVPATPYCPPPLSSLYSVSESWIQYLVLAIRRETTRTTATTTTKQTEILYVPDIHTLFVYVLDIHT